MPIYEFYCSDCHMVFSFFSKSVNTRKTPGCPRCKRKQLERQVSSFAMTGRSGAEDGLDDLPIDEGKMGDAINALASEAENINEEDPRQAARLIRKFSSMTGVQFGDNIEEAIGRLEAGEDPDKIEADMGDMTEDEEPLIVQGKKETGVGDTRRARTAPHRDVTLYEM